MGEPGKGHLAPWRSAERTAYFEALMDQYAELGDRHLPFTPPTTRGSLITRAEAWIINTQRRYVPTLDDLGRWPEIAIGAHPDTMSDEQTRWLSESVNWGAGARLWAEAGCPGALMVPLAPAREQKKKEEYAALVMRTWDRFEHQDKREFRDTKSAVERAARQRL